MDSINKTNKSIKQKKTIEKNKKYEVTFLENTKNNPMIHTVIVEAKSRPIAVYWVLHEFGRKKIKIESCKEVKDVGDNDDTE